MQRERGHVFQHYESQTWCQNKEQCFQKWKKHSQKSSKKYPSQSVEKPEKNRAFTFGELPRNKESKDSEKRIQQLRHDLAWIPNNQKLFLAQARSRKCARCKGCRQHLHLVRRPRLSGRESGSQVHTHTGPWTETQVTDRHWEQSPDATYLEIHCYYKSRSNGHSKRLVVWRRLSILSHSLQIRSQRYEEENHRC